MAGMVKKTKKVVRTRTRRKATNAHTDIWKKILADQQLIRDELQKGTSLKELEKIYGFRFASLPPATD
ncbi:MAG: hypothetical protein JNM68_05405 [Dinghuibacter sp.]|nr:hypothetical protein [Dinghuibacter sp.]